jgi:hypothetical protein
MSVSPVLFLIMTVGGAVFIGLALAYGLISTRKRRENPLAQRLTDAATRELYEEEEQARRHENAEPLGGQAANITRARQGVTGHSVNVVLATSLALALFAGVGLFVFVWVIGG